MDTERILKKVYRASAIIIVSVIALACLVCKWPLWMIAIAMLSSIVISSPATICLHILTWLFQKTKFEKGFVWVILMASIPPFSFIAAWLFADFVPGKVWFLLLLGILSGYIGILSQGTQVAEFFNSTEYEREKDNAID
jgi:hypothetical protein